MDLITVFGHSGFVGSNFVKLCNDKGVPLCLPERWSRRPHAESTDIVNFVSTVHNYNVFDNPSLDVATNLVILTEMLESWKNNRPEAVFNQISSWFVYGNPTHFPAREYSPCNPRGFYSITKRAAEQLVISFAETFGLKYRIIRLANVLGSSDKGVSAQKNALQFLIKKMCAGEPVEIYDRGNFYRTYVDVEDCVEAIHFIMGEGKPINEIYNVGSSPPHKFIDLINYIHIRTGRKSDIKFIEQRKFHKAVQTKSFCMDCSKLTLMGWVAKKNVYATIDGIIDLINTK